MNETIVFGRGLNVSFAVTPSPLIGVIEGGFQRHIGSQSLADILVDGSLSLDPDYPDAADLRYSFSFLFTIMNADTVFLFVVMFGCYSAVLIF